VHPKIELETVVEPANPLNWQQTVACVIGAAVCRLSGDIPVESGCVHWVWPISDIRTGQYDVQLLAVVLYDEVLGGGSLYGKGL
jgi:hypothetical protein